MLRCLQLVEAELSMSFVEAMNHIEGPIAWCTLFCTTDNIRGAKFLVNLNRQCVKMAISSTETMRIPITVVAITSMLSEPSPDWEVILDHFCHCLDSPCALVPFQEVDALARRLMKMFRMSATTKGDPKIAVLVDRMARVAQKSNSAEAVTFWLQQALTTVRDPGLKLAFSLDRAMLSLKLATEETCLSLLSESCASINDIDPLCLNKSEACMLCKSISNSCSDLKTTLTRQPGTKHAVQQMIDSSCACLLRAATSEYSSQWQSLKTASSNTIRAWLSIYTIADNDHMDTTVARTAKTCFELAQTLELGDLANAIAVMMYNSGGLLYSKGEFERAALYLETHFHFCPLNIKSVKQIEYLWSAYLQSGDYQMAALWLSRVIEVTSETLAKHHDSQLLEELQICEPALSRLISKLTNLALDRHITIPDMIGLDNETQGILLEWQVMILERLAPSFRCQQMFHDIVARALFTYDRAGVSVGSLRILSCSLAYARRCHDLERSTFYLRLALDRLEVEPDEQSLIQKVFALRIRTHALPDNSEVLSKVQSLVIDTKDILRQAGQGQTSCLLSFVTAVVQELQCTIEHLHVPMARIQIIDALLAFDLAAKTLTPLERSRLHVEVAELYLECGQISRAGIHLNRANKDDVVKSMPDLHFKLMIASFKHAIEAGQHGQIEIAQIGQVLTRMPKNLSSNCQALALHCLAMFAANHGCTVRAIEFDLQALHYARKSLSQDVSRATAPPNEDNSLETTVSALSLADRTSIEPMSSPLLRELLMSLGDLHEKSGLIKDALYYMNEALPMHAQSDHDCAYRKLIIRHRRLLSRAGMEMKPLVHGTVGCQNPIHELEQLRLHAELDSHENPQSAIEYLLLARKLVRETTSSAEIVPATVRRTASNSMAKKVHSQGTSKDLSLLTKEDLAISCALLMIYDEQGDEENASIYAAELNKFKEVPRPGHQIVYALARRSLRQAEASLLADPIYGVLQESALSLPNVCSITRTTEITTRGKRKLPNEKQAPVATTQDLQSSLSQASDLLVNGFHDWLVDGDSCSAYACSNLHTSVNLMNSALISPRAEVSSQSALTNYLLESSRATALKKEEERRIMELDPSHSMRWPQKVNLIQRPDVSPRSTFQEQYLDIIPKSWIVVSIGLSATKKDLIITRMQALRAPLMLRLPLSRHTARDIDEDVFEFETARSELADIIRQSDTSAQEAKHIKDKSGKTKWWSHRQELDTRLKTLLDNIEHCWLGGFKGIFNNSGTEADRADQFRTSFAKILLKYVPLRKNRSFDLDSRVLDLFIDLGPLDADESLEVLEDLLYFVLDIYQFHGESIAYDEIDIDQMVVDVQNSLNKLHESRVGPQSQHTIIILDKALHKFPWESIPCLRQKSISRVPSLAVLRHLLKVYERPQNFGVDRQQGSYILNPGEDLKGTQRTFAGVLGELPGWHGTKGQKPSEEQFIKYLEGSSIFVYMGHGGGEQYIRGSKIKRLKACGTVILMGCSSGALKDQGIFDPWGTAYNYLVAKW